MKNELEALRALILAQGKALGALERRIEALENPEEDVRHAEIAERSRRVERAQIDRKLRDLENDMEDLRRQK